MNLYLQMLFATLAVVFIVDLSGFTDSWTGALARWLRSDPEHLRPVKPFGCSLCVTWWTCLILAAVSGHILDPSAWAAAAGFAWSAQYIRALAFALGDILSRIISKIR